MEYLKEIMNARGIKSAKELVEQMNAKYCHNLTEERAKELIKDENEPPTLRELWSLCVFFDVRHNFFLSDPLAYADYYVKELQGYIEQVSADYAKDGYELQLFWQSMIPLVDTKEEVDNLASAITSCMDDLSTPEDDDKTHLIWYAMLDVLMTHIINKFDLDGDAEEEVKKAWLEEGNDEDDWYGVEELMERHENSICSSLSIPDCISNYIKEKDPEWYEKLANVTKVFM